MLKTVITFGVLLLPLSIAFAETYVGVININGSIQSSDCTKGNGKVQSETRALEPFEEIEISGALNVRIIDGPHYEAIVEIDSNILPLIASKVKGKTLYLGPENAHLCLKKPIKVTVTTPAVEKIYVDGANDVTMEWSQDYGNLSLNLSGSSDFILIGHGQSLTVVMDGASDLDARDGAARVVNITTNGSSTGIVSSLQELVATSHDASDIYYTGPIVQKQISSHDASDILPLSEK